VRDTLIRPQQQTLASSSRGESPGVAGSILATNGVGGADENTANMHATFAVDPS
jgi:hypothetical protein